MGRMIGGDGINGSVSKTFNHRFDILGGPQGRFDLRVRVIPHNRFVSQGEVVWTCLGGNRQTVCLGSPDKFNHQFAAHVGNVNASSELLNQRDVSRHLGIGCRCRDTFKTKPGGNRSLMHNAVTGDGQILCVIDDQ